MESNWAAENLQVIRTLMERSAVYRRALAPVMLTAGVIGSGAAIGAWAGKISSPRGFIAYWMAVAIVALLASLVLVRRQALREGEPFWSPPTRRVTRAFVPPLFVGLVVGPLSSSGAGFECVQPWALPALWMLLYGCALHAAGFFMVRGIRLFGWIFLLCGGALLAGCFVASATPSPRFSHLIMGLAFGGLHLAYGIYLYFTERSRKSA